MHDAAFAAAARPARYVILGLPMMPYSIGHEILLTAQGNPLTLPNFETLDDSIKVQSVIRAVLICSQSWKRNHKPHRWLRLWRWKNTFADYALAIAEFKNYRAEGCAFPNVPDEMIAGIANGEEKKGRQLGAPYLARVFNFCAALPYSEIRLWGDTIFDFPFSLANFIYSAQLEFNGDLKVENQKEFEIKKEFDEHMEYFKKQKEAK